MMNTSLNRSACSTEGESPLEELSNLLDRIEHRIEAARNAHQEAVLEATKPAAAPSTPARGFGRFLGRRRDETTPTRKTPTAPSPSPSPLRPAEKIQGPLVDFIPFPEQDEFIEDLRRAAELCIIGENFVTSMLRKEDLYKQRQKEKWAAARDAIEGEEESEQPDNDTIALNEEKLQLFDLFFERNAMAMIVNMLYGESFHFEKSNDSDEDEPIELEVETLLPPLRIATQALQSISILIQNVSRATSLYVLLSNNYINKLIDLPLDLYTTAEKRRLIASKESKTLPAVFASPQITEVATHFVTFLKSLALRMNAETLQFFLKYPEENMGEGTSTASASHFSQRSNEASESSTPDQDDVPKVEFPLYLRALEFCAAHQDSFVRTTALNICLNTLRLTTIAGEDELPEGVDLKVLSSPDGVLYNAKPLPYRERLVIAQYACIPSRVEHLISPIFTKLAERWSALDEQIRVIDSNKHMGFTESTDDVGARNEKVVLAKEKVRRERLIRGFKDKVADLQDELLLLDDVFKVGLTVLNEQLVETMLATFVYPMLLQPLVLYCQRLTASVDEDRFSFSDHPFGGISVDLSDVDKALLPVSGPAKAALFTLGSVFKFLSNRPLLRLLYTVLFHPLSPDSTSAPTVRSKLEVATVDPRGRKCIRLDRVYPVGEPIPDDRTTYAFGTSPMSRRRSKANLVAMGGDNEACVFVLAPALAEVLEFRGEDIALIARTRPNPYRRALLKCLTVPEDMADVRELTVCIFDAALSAFDGNFGSVILFGSDLKKFADDMPADERNLDSVYAHMDDDRGIGGSAEFESRLSFASQRGGSIGADLMGEVVSALCSCVVVGSRVASNEWKLGYDDVAAHALLTAVQHHPGAIVAASKIIETRWRQASVALAEIPSSGLNPMGGSSIILPGSPSINIPDYEDRIFESFLNIVFYDTFNLGLGGTPVAEEFLQLKDTVDADSRDGYAVAISCASDLESLNSRVGSFLLAEDHGSGLRAFDLEMIEERREGARTWVKVDALLTLLKDLASTAGLSIRGVSLAGIAVSAAGSVVKLDEALASRLVYANVSSVMTNFLYADSGDDYQPEPRSVIDLVDSPAIPCVCEAAGPAAQYFADDASGAVVAEGVTWQSLYIVFVHRQQFQFLVFAQPLPADETGGNGRVIAACNLERVTVERDVTLPDDGSPARRLSLYYKWFNRTPPPLFLFDAMPEFEEYGPFLHVKPFTSRLDLWFENEMTAYQAYTIISSQIFMAKSQRGRRLQTFLDPQAEQRSL